MGELMRVDIELMASKLPGDGEGSESKITCESVKGVKVIKLLESIVRPD